MKKLLIFIGVCVFSCSFGYGRATVQSDATDLCIIQEPQPVPQLPADIRATFENDVRALYNRRVELMMAHSDKRLSDEESKSLANESVRILKEYNLRERAIEAGYCKTGTSVTTNGNIVRIENWYETTVENQRVMKAFYEPNPPTIDDILANDCILPLEKLQLATSLAINKTIRENEN